MLSRVVRIGCVVKELTRWKPDEYNHQFEHNMGIGNLRDGYVNGDYGFDVLGLLPEGKGSRRRMLEKELNHGRLAMIAIIGMIAQEYFTGISVYESASRLLYGDGMDARIPISTMPNFFDQINGLLRFIQEQISQAGFGVEIPMSAPQ